MYHEYSGVGLVGISIILAVDGDIFSFEQYYIWLRFHFRTLYTGVSTYCGRGVHGSSHQGNYLQLLPVIMLNHIGSNDLAFTPV